MIEKIDVLDRGARREIHVFTDDGNIHVIDGMAIASWSELLGYAEPDEALEAILKAAMEASNEEAGDDVWEEAYMLLTHRERERENEAERARVEGKRDDPRSPELRAALAAYHAVHEPVDGGECVMDRCRRRARDRMKLPEPTRKNGAGSRQSKSSGRCRKERPDPATDKGKLREAAEACEPWTRREMQDFLHSITGKDRDPLAEPESEPEEPEDPLETIFRRYGGKSPNAGGGNV